MKCQQPPGNCNAVPLSGSDYCATHNHARNISKAATVLNRHDRPETIEPALTLLSRLRTSGLLDTIELSGGTLGVPFTARSAANSVSFQGHPFACNAESHQGFEHTIISLACALFDKGYHRL